MMSRWLTLIFLSFALQKSTHRLKKAILIGDNPIPQSLSTPDEVQPSPGQHQKKQLQRLLNKISLYPYQVVLLADLVDVNSDGLISDKEWAQFYLIFVTSFTACKPDATTYLLNSQLIKDCKHVSTLDFLSEMPGPEIEQLLLVTDQEKGLNLYGYVLFRRLGKAVANCSENGTFPLTKLVCALQIAVDSYNLVRSPDDKLTYQLAKILTIGDYIQTYTYLSTIELFAVAQYLITYGKFESTAKIGYFKETDLLVANADQRLPDDINIYVIQGFFEYDKEMNHLSFALSLYHYYHYRKACDKSTKTNCLVYKNFKSLVKTMPQSQQELIKTLVVPSQKLVEAASEVLSNAQAVGEDTYFGAFLQTGEVTDIVKLYESQVNYNYPKEEELLYRLINRYDNGTLLISDYLEYMKLHFQYKMLDYELTQNMDFSKLQKNWHKLNLLSRSEQQRKTVNDVIYLNQLYDYMQDHAEYAMRYLNFLQYYFLEPSVKFFRSTGFTNTLPLGSCIAAFRKLGLRMTNNVLTRFSNSYDPYIKDYIMNIRQTFDQMLLEDMAVEKFKKKTQPNPPLNIDDQTSK